MATTDSRPVRFPTKCRAVDIVGLHFQTCGGSSTVRQGWEVGGPTPSCDVVFVELRWYWLPCPCIPTGRQLVWLTVGGLRFWCRPIGCECLPEGARERVAQTACREGVLPKGPAFRP